VNAGFVHPRGLDGPTANQQKWHDNLRKPLEVYDG